jgi:hypothetical protein
MSEQFYGTNIIYNMNLVYPGNESIKIPDQTIKLGKAYFPELIIVKLYTPGNNTTNKRIYVAIPADTKVIEDIRRKYNQM